MNIKSQGHPRSLRFNIFTLLFLRLIETKFHVEPPWDGVMKVSTIHVIFSWAQIGRSAIFGREIGVPDREIFSRQKKIRFNVKNCLFASA